MPATWLSPKARLVRAFFMETARDSQDFYGEAPRLAFPFLRRMPAARWVLLYKARKLEAL
jgi:hypothetical protein